MIAVVVVDSLLVGGVRFILDKIAQAVEAELDDADALREELLAAQMRHELGELSDDEFVEREREILARLRDIRKEELARGPVSMTPGATVDVSFGGDDEDR